LQLLHGGKNNRKKGKILRGRYNYTILNAFYQVHYDALTNRTEAKKSEITSPKNIERLSGELELSKAEIVIACGERRSGLSRKLSKIILIFKSYIPFI
jgi:hypothetical protein